MKRFGRPRFTENFTSSTTFEGSGISEAAAAEAAAVEAAAAEAAAERAAVRLPLPAPVGISVPPMPRVPASHLPCSEAVVKAVVVPKAQRTGARPHCIKTRCLKARKCRKERAHNN